MSDGALPATIVYSGVGVGESETPATIGRFAITGVLGRGGMGVVLAGRDPSLGRTVAIKLIPERFAEGDSSRARFEREARSMAKLSHPNVVAVYEVGEIDGHPFIAMEFVDGQTLRAWQTGTPRPWREIVPIYIDAARGLAAAHAAGLVHRDFKPDNVLLGADQRPRVSDFGLVSEGAAATLAAQLDGRELPMLTEHRKWIGTPPYMSREQWLGDSVGPAADQFAYCVALWEALFGERPFSGDTASELCEAICGGRSKPPPAGRDVPRALVRVLERGLAPTAAERWPSMQALIAELQRIVRAPRRLWIAGGAATLAVATAITLVAVRGQSTPDDPCPAPVARASTLWGSGGREAVLARVRAADPAHAEAHVTAIERALDPFVESWRRGQVDACRAEAGAPDALAAQRTACLDERLAFGTALVERIVAAANGAELDTLIPSLATLRTPAACADARTLASFTMPPGAEGRREATAIAEATRALELDRIAGKLAGLSQRGTALLARARTLDHAPTTARALQTVATIESDLTNSSVAGALMRELTTVAAKAPDDYAAAWAWCSLLRVTAFNLGQAATAVPMIPAAEAAVLRAGDPVELRVLYLQSTADVYQEVARVPDALRALDEARTKLRAAGADAVDSPLHLQLAKLAASRGQALGRAGEHAKAVEAYLEVIKITDETYGAGHPLAAYAYVNLRATYRNLARFEEAEAAQAEAVKIRRARIGPSPALAWALVGHADAVRELRRPKDALAEAEEAYAMGRTYIPEDAPELITITLGAAIVFEDAGNLTRARDMYTAVIEIGARTGAHNVNIPISLLNRGNVAIKQKDFRTALPDYERAFALFTEFRGPGDYYNLYALRAIAHAELALGKPADGLRHLDAALAIKAPPRVAGELILIRYLHGVALIQSGRDREGGRREVAKVRAEVAKGGAEDLAELDDLLPND